MVANAAAYAGAATAVGQSVTRELLADGMAGVYTYNEVLPGSECWDVEDNAEFAMVESLSRPDQTPPWEWRHESKTGKSKMKIAAAAGSVFHGNVKSHVFHRPGCQHYYCKHCVAEFPSREAAIKAGFRPCGVCKP